jgi:sRNA-binding protein
VGSAIQNVRMTPECIRHGATDRLKRAGLRRLIDLTVAMGSSTACAGRRRRLERRAQSKSSPFHDRSMSEESTPPPAPAELNPADCAARLKQLFPALFSGAPKPLKLRIQVDIQERAPGVFTKQALSAFFRRHTGSTAYLIAVSKSKQRFDLDGQPQGDLSDEHRKVALEELARRRTSHESRIALEEQQRRNRATLLHDFQATTLTPANFCALKGIAVEELDGYLATARREAEERAQHSPAFDPRAQPGRQRQSPGRH